MDKKQTLHAQSERFQQVGYEIGKIPLISIRKKSMPALVAEPLYINHVFLMSRYNGSTNWNSLMEERLTSV